MDIEKFTERARGFIQSAQSLALREGNQQFVPEHLLKVLLDDEEGLAARLIGPLRIAAHGLVGVTLPRIVVDAAGRETDTWGHPLLGVTLGLELARTDHDETRP